MVAEEIICNDTVITRATPVVDIPMGWRMAAVEANTTDALDRLTAVEAHDTEEGRRFDLIMQRAFERINALEMDNKELELRIAKLEKMAEGDRK